MSDLPVRTYEKARDPQERNGSIKRISGLDTYEKPAQANIQGVGIHLVKINNPMGRCNSHQKAGVHIWEEKLPH